MIKALPVLLIIVLMFMQGCATTPSSIEEGDNYFKKRDYISAVLAYERGLSQVRDADDRKTIEQKLSSAKVSIADEYLAKAAKIQDKDTLISVPVINEKLELLEKVSQWDDSSKRITSKIDEYKRQRERLLKDIQITLQNTLREADDYNYNRALELIEEALSIDRLNDDLQKTRRNIMDRKDYFEAVKKYLSDGDLDNAINAYNKLSDASSHTLKFSSFPLRDSFATLIVKRVTALKKRNKWFDAYTLLKRFELVKLNKELREIKSKGSKYYYEKAKTSLKTHQDYFKGYIYAFKAYELDPTQSGVFQIHKEAQDYVNKSLQKYIAIASFDSPSNEPDAGKQYSDSLISYLYRVLPYGINILERDKIDFVLREHQRETKSVGEVLGADLMVSGTVSLFKIDRNVDKRTATIKVKLGEETVENPEFLQMMKMYGARTSKWPSIPPKTIQKDKYQLINYSKGTISMKGFAKVSIRIFDTQKGTITFVKDFDASVVKSCEFQDEVKEANIPGIAISLPADTEMKEEMRKEIVSEIAKVVQASFENRETRFLNQAKFFLDRREYKNAIKPLAEGHLYCILDNIKPDNKVFLELNELSSELIE